MGAYAPAVLGRTQGVALGFGVFIPEAVSLESAVLFDPNLYPLAREGQRRENSTEYWITGAAAIDLGPVSVGSARSSS